MFSDAVSADATPLVTHGAWQKHHLQDTSKGLLHSDPGPVVLLCFIPAINYLEKSLF